MRLLLLTDDEAVFVEEALGLWVEINAGEEGPAMDRARVDRFQIQRKFEGKYTAQEVEDVGQVALGIMRSEQSARHGQPPVGLH